MPESSEWTWTESNYTKTAIVAVMLIKQNHSIAITFPRSETWGRNREHDRDLVRAMLLEVAHEPWDSGHMAS